MSFINFAIRKDLASRKIRKILMAEEPSNKSQTMLNTPKDVIAKSNQFQKGEGLQKKPHMP
jgi:hypothetical protein